MDNQNVPLTTRCKSDTILVSTRTERVEYRSKTVLPHFQPNNGTIIQLRTDCGTHKRALDSRIPLAPQVQDVFASAPIRFHYGVIQAAYAQINGLLVIYDGFQIGFVHTAIPRQEDWSAWQMNLILQHSSLTYAKPADLQTNAVRRFYVNESGVVHFVV